MAENQPTSLTLLERIRANDQEAWNRVVHLYTPLIRYWCCLGGISHGELDDLVQEVFRAVTSGIAEFRRDRPGDSFRGWLRGVTRNKVLDWYRLRDRHPDGAAGGTEAGRLLREQPDPFSDTKDAEDPQEQREIDAVYQRALEFVRSEFEAKTWEAFWRVTVEGRSTADVAADLGVSTAVVRQAKSRILRRLKQEVGELIR